MAELLSATLARGRNYQTFSPNLKGLYDEYKYFGCSFVNYCPTQVRSVGLVYCPTEIFVCLWEWKWPADKLTHFQRPCWVLLQMSSYGFTTQTVSFCFRNFSTVLIILTLSSQPKMTIFLLSFVPFPFPLFIVNVTGFWDKKKIYVMKYSMIDH